MRALPLFLALVALLVAAPAFAQERAPLSDDFRSFTADQGVTLESPATLLPAAADEASEAGADMDEETTESRTDTAADAPLQEVGSRNWLYLVAAIVAGGIILAVVL